MKFINVRPLVFFGALFLCACMVRGQGRTEVQLSVVFKRESLREILNYLERETGVKFVYSASHLDLDERISIDIAHVSLPNILNRLLTPRGIRYLPQEGTAFIVLVSAPITGPLRPVPITVKGQVLSAGNNIPLSSVSVVVRGTPRGTITDVTGRYVLEAGADDVLVFTYLGFERIEVPVNGQTVLNATLKEDVSSLHEVMVNAGYWQIPERQQTGNIAKVMTEQVTAQPASNVLQVLQGNMPGIIVSQASGLPGSYFNVEIRGRNSLRTTANEPLYIIDGVPYISQTFLSSYTPSANASSSPLNAINPGDIESIEVLKDADATAIYGTRGANGVILITTRRGRNGPTQVTLNVYSGVGQVARQLDLLDTRQWLAMRREAFANDKLTPTVRNAPDMLVWDTTRYTDWQKELFGGTAGITNGQVVIDGGDDRTQFNLSTSFRRETTVLPGDFGYGRVSGHFNLGHNSTDKKFRMSFTTEFVGEENDLPQADPTAVATTTLPLAPPVYDSLGKLNWVAGSNPYAALFRTYSGRSRTLLTNAALEYKPLQNWLFKVNMGYTMYRGRDTGREPIISNNPIQAPTGRSRLAVTTADGWILEPMAEYTRYISKGKLVLLSGMTLLENVRQSDAFIGSGYTSDALLANLNAAPTIEADQSDHTVYRYMAAFGRIHYAWQNRYFINLTGRRDGSSRFGANRHFANFGAVGMAWLFSEEPFLHGMPDYFSFGKLRASYGITGSDQIGDYQYERVYQPAPNPYDGGEAIIPSRLVNPDFGWESNRKFEMATDFGFLNNRIHVTASWYSNRSGNQLVGYPLPTLTGEPSVQANLNATVVNTGWEFSSRTVNVSNNQFSWVTTFNLTVPQNWLASYPGLAGSTYANTLEIGKSLYLIRQYHASGVNSETGIYSVEDRDNDGFLTLADYQGRIENMKQYYGAINNTLKYRGWVLDFMFQFSRQPGISDFGLMGGVPGSRASNQPVAIFERWRKPGDETSVQRFTTLAGSTAGLQYINYRNSDAMYMDTHIFRLRAVSLSWELPGTWARRANLKRAQVYAQGQNVLLFTNSSARDPEQFNTGKIPPLRMVTFGVNITL